MLKLFLTLFWDLVKDVMLRCPESEVSGKREIGLSSSVVPLSDHRRVQAEFKASSYPKLTSIIRLEEIGLPTLPGFAIKEVTSEVLDVLSSWMSSTGSERLSLRFDSPRPEDLMKLLGSNLTLEELSGMRSLISAPIIGIVLAENDRFKQGHSVLTQFTKGCLKCEIVGPGFDAADITRGRISPHEIYTIKHKSVDVHLLNPEFSLSDIEKHQIVGSEEYEHSRKLRYGVIADILDKGLGRGGSSRRLALGQERRVEDFLAQRQAVIPESYQPLGWESLRLLYDEYLGPLDTFREYYRENFQLDVEGRVLSASFLRKHGLVFWDLYGPDKYS